MRNAKKGGIYESKVGARKQCGRDGVDGYFVLSVVCVVSGQDDGTQRSTKMPTSVVSMTKRPELDREAEAFRQVQEVDLGPHGP